MSFAINAKTLVVWNDEFMPKEAAQIILDYIKANCAKHVGSFGKKYSPNRQGNPDWRESGRMLDRAIAYRGGKIKFFASYTVYVNKRYPFLDGMSFEDKRELGKLLKPIIAKRLKARRG